MRDLFKVHTALRLVNMIDLGASKIINSIHIMWYALHKQSYSLEMHRNGNSVAIEGDRQHHVCDSNLKLLASGHNKHS